MSQMTAPTPAFSPEPQNEASDQGGRRLERQLFIALLGGMLLLVSGIARLFGASAAVSDIPAAIGAILLLIPLHPLLLLLLDSSTATYMSHCHLYI